MSLAMNGQNFESQLRAAAIKLRRAKESDQGFDLDTGFSIDEIVSFIEELPELGNETQLSQSRAVLRRNGLVKRAEELAV